MKEILVGFKDKTVEILRKNVTGESVKTFCADFIYMLIACSIGAFSLTAVLIPNGLTSGGVTGIVRIVQTFIPLNFSLLYYCGTMTLLVVVTIFMGFKEGRKIVLLSTLYPAVLFVFEQFHFNLLEEKDIILAAIFCGVFGGVCSGIVFWRGYSFGGTDSLAKVLKKKLFPGIALSQMLLIIDATIIVCSAFLFGRNIALYALITQVITAKTIDFVLYGLETKIVKLEIITRAPDEVTAYIINDISRGVSETVITGAYTKTERKMLMTLCSPRESVLIKKYIAKIDHKAFVTVVHLDSAWGSGEGFSDINEN